MKNSYLVLRIRLFFMMLKHGKISLKKIFNALHCYAAYSLKLTKSAPSPYLMNFELWNECNEQCMFCRTSEGGIFDANPKGPGGYLSKGTMPFEVYTGMLSQVKDRLIMAIPYINGEPLLSKDIYRAIQFATDNKVATLIASNGVLLNEQNAQKLLRAGLDLIKIHISGFTQPVHSIEHRKCDVEKIKENVRRLVQLKNEGGYHTMVLLDYIYYEHNKHEVELARKFSDELNIIFNLRKGYIKGLENLEPRPPVESSAAHIPCDWLWTVLSVDWNGAIYPCCDHAVWSGAESYANFKDDPTTDILKLWNGPKVAKMRNTHLTEGRTPIPVCSSCTRVGVKFKL